MYLIKSLRYPIFLCVCVEMFIIFTAAIIYSKYFKTIPEMKSTKPPPELKEVYRSPKWTNGKPVQIRFNKYERGWAYHIKDNTYRLANTPNNTYRLANTPISSTSGCGHLGLPQWGDLVTPSGDLAIKDGLTILEKFAPDNYLVKDHFVYYKELQNTLQEHRDALATLRSTPSTPTSDIELLECRCRDTLKQLDRTWEHLTVEEVDRLVNGQTVSLSKF